MKHVISTILLGSSFALTGVAFGGAKKEAKPAQTEETCPVIGSVIAKTSVEKGHKDFAKHLKSVNAGSAKFKCFSSADEAAKAGFPAAQ